MDIEQRLREDAARFQAEFATINLEESLERILRVLHRLNGGTVAPIAEEPGRARLRALATIEEQTGE